MSHSAAPLLQCLSLRLPLLFVDETDNGFEPNHRPLPTLPGESCNLQNLSLTYLSLQHVEPPSTIIQFINILEALPQIQTLELVDVISQSSQSAPGLSDKIITLNKLEQLSLEETLRDTVALLSHLQYSSIAISCLGGTQQIELLYLISCRLRHEGAINYPVIQSVYLTGDDDTLEFYLYDETKHWPDSWSDSFPDWERDWRGDWDGALVELRLCFDTDHELGRRRRLTSEAFFPQFYLRQVETLAFDFNGSYPSESLSTEDLTQSLCAAMPALKTIALQYSGDQQVAQFCHSLAQRLIRPLNSEAVHPIPSLPV
ncbi:hypothetical protein D9756_002338 [Leucocoprinus leucothites]|uniref:Uncharacterized protein n=1 Tax=Leucocoprinus leucothites TaxID=201217 RepID=A0A8H5GBZ2_9AGAR|nr:hypothetical protein D9756_002338 [Leucoagaricus leucothites]